MFYIDFFVVLWYNIHTRDGGAVVFLCRQFGGFLYKGVLMSRQIQIRRGSAAENDAFTGAIGEVTMDTTNKTLRVHDGATAGGTKLAKQSEIPDLASADYVVESQLPTANNNYTWYRKYKSGWVEMGGQITVSSSSGETVSLPIEMADAYYQVYTHILDDTQSGYVFEVQIRQRTVSSFHAREIASYNDSQWVSGYVFEWFAMGVAA